MGGISEDMGALFKLVDTDGDGYISFMDFLSATLPPGVLNDDKNFSAVFEFFDRNGDGFIDVNDLVEALDKKAPKEKEACIDAMREACPAQPHRLSFQQFLSF